MRRGIIGHCKEREKNDVMDGAAIYARGKNAIIGLMVCMIRKKSDMQQQENIIYHGLYGHILFYLILLSIDICGISRKEHLREST